MIDKRTLLENKGVALLDLLCFQVHSCNLFARVLLCLFASKLAKHYQEWTLASMGIAIELGFCVDYSGGKFMMRLAPWKAWMTW